jgi:hypothetical protein
VFLLYSKIQLRQDSNVRSNQPPIAYRSLRIHSVMYGGQLRSSVPWTTQAPRKRTASTSTRVTSFRSSATFPVTSSSSLFNSKTPSGSIRPLSRRIVFCFSEPRSILKVTSGYQHCAECTSESTPRHLNTEWIRGGRVAEIVIWRSSPFASARRMQGVDGRPAPQSQGQK